MLIIGEFRHTVDQANRLTVPARYREPFGADAVLYRAPEGCLFLYTVQEFERIANESRSGKNSVAAREKVRNFFSDAACVTVDRTGRFIIPNDYMAAASLKAEVVLLGCANHFEIWDAGEYDEMMKNKDTLADSDYPDVVF